MAENRVRGSVINGYLKYVERTWGKDGMERCRAEAKLTDLDIKDGVLYPYIMEQGVVKWISKNYGMESVRKAGRHTVKNLGLLAYLVRFASIETMLEKAKTSYHEAYDFGYVDIKISGKTAVATMRDVSEIPENCEGWIGALEGLLELNKKKGRVTHTKCQLKGAEACEYEMAWD